MMDDLIGWLCVQLDDDEALARAAPPGSWTAIPANSQGSIVERDAPTYPARYVIVPDEYGDGVVPADAAHIARHDPARILREVEAKRRILNRIESLLRPMPADASSAAVGIVTARLTEYELHVLPLLALPYSDRPGYREEWRP
jgi:hypothetical protein